MSVIDTLKALAITVRNEKKKEANSAIRIGDLFLAIIDFIKGLTSGQIRQEGVDTYNDTSGGQTSLLSSYPDPQIGWTVLVRKDETNGGKASLYQWNGSRWINLETMAYVDDIVIKPDLPPVEALALDINTEKSDTVTAQMTKGLKAFNVFRLVLFKGYENNEYFLFGLYNWPVSGGVPLFKLAKLDGSGNRKQLTPNNLLGDPVNLNYVQSNVLQRIYLNDGAGYIEFSIDMGLYGGYDPSSQITYLHESDNKKLYLKPSRIEPKNTIYKRANLEYYRRYYYDRSGNRITGDHASQKSAIYPIKGNTQPIKITTHLSGDVPALVFFDENMRFIQYFEDTTVNKQYDNYEIPFYSETPNWYHSFSKAAFMGINGEVGYEQSVWIGDTEQTEFKLEQLNIPISSYTDSAFWDGSGKQTGDYADMCFVELKCTQKDVIAVSQYMYAPIAPLAVYVDKDGNILDAEAGGARTNHEFYYLTIPKDAAKVYINGSINFGRIKVFVSGKVSDYLDTQLKVYNQQDITRTSSSYFDKDGQQITGHPAQSATKYRVSPGEEFLIDTVTSGFVPLAVVTDISGNVIEYKEMATVNEIRTFKKYPYEIPMGGFWLMANGTPDNPLILQRKSIEPVLKNTVSDFQKSTQSQFSTIDNQLKIQTFWINGKKVLWLGTSIPAGGEYPERSCASVGAACINQSLGASFIQYGEQMPTTAVNNSELHRMSSLIETIAEKKAIWLDRGMCTEDQFEFAKNSSYEIKLLPYLTGINKVDLVVIDHGFNDRNTLGTIDDLKNKNKSTFVGAMAALIELIRTIDFRTRIMICTHYDNTMTVFNAANLCKAQELVGETLGVPVFKVYEKVGLSNEWIPGTADLHPGYYKYEPNPDTGDLTLIQCWMPDGFHIHSSTTGEIQAVFADVHATNLRSIR